MLKVRGDGIMSLENWEVAVMEAYDKLVKNRKAIFAKARMNGIHDSQGHLLMAKDDPWRKTVPWDDDCRDVTGTETEREYKMAAY